MATKKSKDSTLFDEIGQFTGIPNWIIEMGQEIGTDGLALFVALRYHSGKDGKIFPSYETIREHTGLTFRKIAKAIRRLEELKIIERQKRFGQSTIYRLKNKLIEYSSTAGVGVEDSSPTAGVVRSYSICSKVLQQVQTNKTHKTRINKQDSFTAVPAVSAIFSFDGEADVIPETVLTSKKKGAGAKSTAGPYYHDEAVQIYRGITRLTPNLIQQEKIHEEVHDLNLWKSTVEWFMVDGKDKTKVGWMIDSYKKGGKEKVIAGYIEAKRNGNGHQPEHERIAAEDY